MNYIKKRKKLSRRAFLRGAVGGAGAACIGLPLLESMTDSQGRVWAQDGTTSQTPTRYVFTFAGVSIGASGEPTTDFIPTQSGDLAGNLPAALTPLESVVDHVNVVSNLEIPWVTREGETPGPGGRIVQFHGGAQGPLLTGVRSKGDRGREWIAGETSDQKVARAFGTQPLLLRVQAGLYVPGNTIGFTSKSISYTDSGRTAVEPLVDPHRVFESLFGPGSGFTPPEANAEERALRERLLNDRRSVLDGVSSSYDRLKKKYGLGRADQQRLEQHFDEIRSLEKRLDNLALEQAAVGQLCKMPDEPRMSWPISEGTKNGEGTELSWSNEDLRAEAMTDLLYHALVCDLTRVASLQYTIRQSFMSARYITSAGQTTDLHELGHSRGDRQDVRDIHRWHLRYFRDLVDRLASAPEGNGASVLDNTAMLYVPEAGFGFNPESGSDHQTHSTENMAIITAGHAGGLVGGKHIQAPSGANHPANVYCTAMKAVGVPDGDRFGEVSGIIPELLS